MKTNVGMDCPVCGGKMVVRPTVRQTARILRMYTCLECTRRFVSEDVLYPIETERGKALHHELNHLRYEHGKMAALVPKPKKESKPKQKRKVAGPTKPVKEGEVYLTYGEIFKKFKEKDPFHGESISDYRPYPLMDHAIIVWFKKSRIYRNDAEIVYQYNPETDEFTRIENAMSYEDILAGKWRK